MKLSSFEGVNSHYFIVLSWLSGPRAPKVIISQNYQKLGDIHWKNVGRYKNTGLPSLPQLVVLSYLLLPTFLPKSGSLTYQLLLHTTFNFTWISTRFWENSTNQDQNFQLLPPVFYGYVPDLGRKVPTGIKISQLMLPVFHGHLPYFGRKVPTGIKKPSFCLHFFMNIYQSQRENY